MDETAELGAFVAYAASVGRAAASEVETFVVHSWDMVDVEQILEIQVQSLVGSL